MQRPLLFSAHPGHELRVYGWLKQTKPAVCFLTDGSGADGVSRASRTTRFPSSGTRSKHPPVRRRNR